MNSESKNPNSKFRILVVEDSPIQAEVLKRTLVQQGYEVLMAENGAEGLEKAQEHKPHLIISDILMPVMDGYEMCKKIKQIKELTEMPIVLLTQLTDTDEVIKGLESGAYSFLTKPYHEEFLISKVKSILENPDRYKNRPDRKSIEFEYDGKHYEVHSSRVQTLSYLITTYENAVLKNKELAKAEEELRLLNEQLEEKVKEKTNELQNDRDKLAERIEELERYKKATIQRELRMKELKEKVEQMEKEK